MTVSWQRELFGEVAELADALRRQALTDADTVLSDLTESAVKAVPSARYAGITIVCRDGSVRTAAATHCFVVLLDEIQQRHVEGPGLSAARDEKPMRSGDIAGDDRWPKFCRDAVEETPIRSTMAFRLFADRRAAAALSFYAEDLDAFDDDSVDLGLTCATYAALAWNLVRRDEQFRTALASRDIIGQAKGMLMERYKIDAEQAFELLKRVSQSSNTPLAAAARRLVEAEHPG